MNSWTTKKLGGVVDVLDNLRKPITKRDRNSGLYPYYGATGIQDHVADYIFDEDLVLVGEDGARWGVGDNSAYKISGKSWVNNHAHVLRPNRDFLLDDWLIYFLNFSDLSEYITGTTVKKLNQEKMRSIKIPFPPIGEQERIVKKLEKLLGKIDEAKRLRAESLEATQSLLPAESHKVFRDGKKKYPFDELGSISTLVRGPFGGSLRKDIFIDSGDCVYEQGNVISNNLDRFRYFITPEKFEEMKRFAVSSGDILMSCSGTIGKFVIIPEKFKKGIINQALLKISPNEKVTVDYLKYALQDYLSLSGSHIKGMAIKNITAVKELKKFKIPIPPLVEQKKIVARLDSLSGKVGKLKKLQSETATDLDALQKSILHQAFEGKLQKLFD